MIGNSEFIVTGLGEIEENTVFSNICIYWDKMHLTLSETSKYTVRYYLLLLKHENAFVFVGVRWN